jgi:hypothetical protein
MLPRRTLALWLALTLLLPLIAPGYSSASSSAPSPAFANSQFEQVWSRTDQPVANGAIARSWLWGPQPGEVRTEPFAEAPGGKRTVQYFDKARMEVNSAVTDPTNPWSTTTGLLVVEMVSGLVQTGASSYDNRSPSNMAVVGDSSAPTSLDTAPRYTSFRDVASLPGSPSRRYPSAIGEPVTATIDRSGKVGTLQDRQNEVRYSAYSPETGHNIPDVFARFMESEDMVNERGALHKARLFDPVYLLGHPISEAYWATAPIGGKSERVLVQLYQRRVLTYVPSFSPGWQVQMGNVGQHYYAWRYSTNAGTASSTATPPAQPSPTAGPGANNTFIHVGGSRLFYQGKPVALKGSNYWLHTDAFVDTWIEWDGPAVKRELERAKQLGANVIRIGVPFGEGRSTEAVWGEGCLDRGSACSEVKGPIVNQMTQFLQIASGYEMKVLFTLFEWTGEFPAAGEPGYHKQVNYLKGVVSPFANDDRVMGWDLHNEPEYYVAWEQDQAREKVITWVGNMAGVLRSLDPNHPVTVGMGRYDNLWAQAWGRGPRIIDLVDIVSFHCYDAGGLRAQINAIQARTQKPILLEEMGWPTGPAQLSRKDAIYDEPTQQFLYRTMMAEVKASPLVGVIQWALQDNLHNDHRLTAAGPSIETWFGLVRVDGSFKPAAADFRDSYIVPPLPSRTNSNVPLTRVEHDDE